MNTVVELPPSWGAKQPQARGVKYSPEVWATERLNGVGASEVASIVGLNPYCSPLLAWQRRKGIAPKPEYTQAMRMGHVLEPVVAKLWEEQTGKECVAWSEGDIFVAANDPARPWLICSPDRWTADGVLLECKTTAHPVDENEPPMAWYVQLQYQMAVCGASEGWLAWLVNGREFGCARYERNDELIADILATVEQYWTINVQGNVAPADTVPSDAMLRYPRPEVEVLEATDALAELVAELKLAKADAKMAEERVKALDEQLRQQIAPYGRVEYGGKVLATYTNNKASIKLDSKRLQAEHPDLCAGYMVEVEGARVLRIK